MNALITLVKKATRNHYRMGLEKNILLLQMQKIIKIRDMFSMLIGSIAIGLSVDDTVHFMHGFRRVFEKTDDALYAVKETLHSSGRAMLSTSIVLTLGFLTYLFSVMNNLQDFGIYTSLCSVVSLLADFWMAPALVLWINRKSLLPAN